jgi:hypothetical protein
LSIKKTNLRCQKEVLNVVRASRRVRCRQDTRLPWRSVAAPRNRRLAVLGLCGVPAAFGFQFQSLIGDRGAAADLFGPRYWLGRWWPQFWLFDLVTKTPAAFGGS